MYEGERLGAETKDVINLHTNSRTVVDDVVQTLSPNPPRSWHLKKENRRISIFFHGGGGGGVLSMIIYAQSCTHQVWTAASDVAVLVKTPPPTFSLSHL